MASILAVDDSASILKMIKLTIEEGTRHEVTTAENGEAGLEVAKSNKAELVITDVNMPMMDGILLVEALRKLPEYANKPILMMSNFSTTDDKLQGKIAGATGWLSKPLTQERLLDAVAKLLD